VELVRSKMTLPDQRVDVQAEPFGDGVIGKITLHSFYEGDDGISSEKDVKKAIDQLRELGPLYGLVLDMRDNTGGFLSQSIKVTGLFISSGVVVISKYSDNTMKFYRTVDGVRHYDGPLVVLISRGSASATEIVAQSLKDYGVAVIVGDEQTYGKGTIQHQTITSEGPPAFFKVTIGRYYTVSGKSTQIDGVKADIIVPSSLNFEEMGEAYLEYPLPSDWVANAYQDPLSDIDPMARKWFQKYYIPTLQQKETTWEESLPQLRINSMRRVQQNQNFQLFLKEVKEKVKPIDVVSFGVNDLQMDEAVNILKDMILMTKTVSTVP
jgi:carboxyl-terminal processing protease